MPFDWMEPWRPPQWAAWVQRRARDAWREEVRARAALLMRLGRSPEQALARCRQNLLWELERTPKALPEVLDELEELVRSVQGRARRLQP